MCHLIVLLIYFHLTWAQLNLSHLIEALLNSSRLFCTSESFCFQRKDLAHNRRCAQKAFARRSLRHGWVYRKAFTRRKPLHMRNFCTQNFCTKKLLHKEAFTQGKFLQKEAFTHSKFLHSETFSQRSFYSQQAFIQTNHISLYTQHLHTAAFTSSKLLHTASFYTGQSHKGRRNLYSTGRSTIRISGSAGPKPKSRRQLWFCSIGWSDPEALWENLLFCGFFLFERPSAMRSGIQMHRSRYKMLRPASHPPDFCSFIGAAKKSGAVPPACWDFLVGGLVVFDMPVQGCSCCFGKTSSQYWVTHTHGSHEGFGQFKYPARTQTNSACGHTSKSKAGVISW